ncbi:hypothetical protein Lfu02_17610 [Longispora fulva]|nr:hypothetical protein Lfu02_17610 [Longispora fulva]
MLSTLAELAGLACLVVAAAILSPVAGWAAAGLCLLLVGRALDGAPVDTLLSTARRGMSTACGYLTRRRAGEAR